MGVAVFSVPLLLSLLGTRDYGTWVTLTSLVAFIGLLDLGVGNSLRNSVAAAGDSVGEDVRAEFVEALHLLAGVGLAALLVFAIGSRFPSSLSEHLLPAALLYAPPLICLPLLLGNSVLQGAKAAGLQAVLQTSGSCAFFLLVGLLAWIGHSPTLEQLALAWSGFYVLALLAAFAIGLRVLRLPVRQLLTRPLTRAPRGRLRVGLEFLVLQLASLILFNLGNMLIFRKLGAGEVARFDVVNKIFQVGLSFFTIIVGVMWSEIARHRADANEHALWLVFRRLALAAACFSGLAIAGAALAPWLIDHWTGHRLQVTAQEGLALATLVSIQSFAYVGAVFMNAFERVRAQIALAVVSIVLLVPVSSWLMNRGAGIMAVPLTSGALTLLSVVLCNLYAIRLVRSVRSIPPAKATP